MSQEKVDQYKKDKANRKKIIARQKRQAFFEKTIAVIIGVAFVAFVGVSAYFKWFDKNDDTVAEAATYSLSEEEISSVWAAYEKPSEEETTSAQDTGSEETEDETVDSSENSEAEDDNEDSDNADDNDDVDDNVDVDNDDDSNEDEE